MTTGTVKILKITEKQKGKNKNGSRGQSALLNINFKPLPVIIVINSI